jgi:hypothetical protein
VGSSVDRTDYLTPVGWLRLASYALGVAVIIDALVQQASATQWVAGLVLVGIVPPEAIVQAVRRRSAREPSQRSSERSNSSG